jgi:MHS family proline/betaine transporter-like MFS transporter
MRTRAIVACSIGNFFELFDFVMYGFLAAIIGRLFFPTSSPTTSLLSSFATYGVGFLMRPVGAIVIGAYGDRRGRKAALVSTISIMALATLGVGLLPTYDQVGLIAPILLLVCRLGQGFSTGGEWGGSAAFMVEYAPNGKRGLVGSWQQASATAGVLAGSLTAAILSSLVTAENMSAWGWRIPFIIGAIAGPVGFYLRSRIGETPEFERVVAAKRVERNPLLVTVKEHRRNLLVAFFICITATVPFYMSFIFMPNFAQQRLGIGYSAALYSTSIASIAATILMPFMGALSDRIGRRPMILGSTLGTLFTCYPLFLFLTTRPGFTSLVVAQVVAVFFVAMFSGPLPAILCEMFPTRVRFTAMSISYGIAVMIFGGFSPFVATYLVNLTGNPISPTYYVMSAAFVSAATAIFFYRETAHRPLQ